jgi:hypothetical protein
VVCYVDSIKETAMDNPTPATPKVVTEYNLKQAIFSVVIGFAISILTILFQHLVDWLQNLPPEFVGGFAGSIKYWKSWKYNHFV